MFVAFMNLSSLKDFPNIFYEFYGILQLLEQYAIFISKGALK